VKKWRGGSGAPRGGEDGGGPWLGRATLGRTAWGGVLAAGKARDWWRRWPVGRLPREQGSEAAHVGRTCGRGPTGEGRELGWAREKSAVLKLNKDF
jgi:hypothetical protein